MPTHADGLSSLLLHIYEAPLNPDVWAEALGKLSTMVGGDAAAVTEWTQTAGAAVRFSHGLSDEFPKQYPRYADMDPFLAAMRRARVLRISMEGEADVAPSPFHRAFLSKQGLRYCAGAMLVDGADRQTFLTVFRTQRSGPFSDMDAKALGYFIPHVRNAVTLTERMERQEESLGLCYGALDCVTRGIVVIDRAGRVVYANAPARTILKANDGFIAGIDELRARRGSDGRRLQAMLALAFDVVDGRRRAEELRPIIITKGARGKRYLLRAHPLPAAHRHRRGDTILVFIRDPLVEPDYKEETIAECMGFTAAEARIARRLASGMSIVETAEALKVSPNTVRTHLRSMFAKTGVNRQVDLLRAMTMTLGIAKS